MARFNAIVLTLVFGAVIGTGVRRGSHDLVAQENEGERKESPKNGSMARPSI